jgi:hypothetical protein
LSQPIKAGPTRAPPRFLLRANRSFNGDLAHGSDVFNVVGNVKGLNEI